MSIDNFLFQNSAVEKAMLDTLTEHLVPINGKEVGVVETTAQRKYTLVVLAKSAPMDRHDTSIAIGTISKALECMELEIWTTDDQLDHVQYRWEGLSRNWRVEPCKEDQQKKRFEATFFSAFEIKTEFQDSCVYSLTRGFVERVLLPNLTRHHKMPTTRVQWMLFRNETVPIAQ